MQSHGKAMNSRNTAVRTALHYRQLLLRHRLAGRICNKAGRNAHPYSGKVNSLFAESQLLSRICIPVFNYLRFLMTSDSCFLLHHYFVEGALLLT